MHRQHSLVFLRRGDKLLLAMKKRGTGQGYWNGAGGKVEPRETIEQAAIRETQEEIGVTPLVLEKVAMHTFILPGQPVPWDVHVYFCTKWEGDPAESEEMAPRWYTIHEIPYEDMWADDVFWLPAVLRGQKLRTSFTFDEQNRVIDASIKPTDF